MRPFSCLSRSIARSSIGSIGLIGSIASIANKRFYSLTPLSPIEKETNSALTNDEHLHNFLGNNL